MPNRILRDSALDSDRIAAVAEASEVLFYRLLMLADDFGRFDGRPAVIRARAFPLRQSVSEAQVIHRLQELCKVGLIYCYAVKGKPYLTIPRFEQRQRAEKSKFPAPPDNWQSDDGQMTVIGQTAAHVVVDVDVGVVKAVGVIPASRDKPHRADAPASPPSVENSTPTGKSNGKAVAYIPLVDSSEYAVTEDLAGELSKLYPAVDIPQTLNEIRGWNLANPTHRKTARGILRHINAWMAKEQNRGPKG